MSKLKAVTGFRNIYFHNCGNCALLVDGESRLYCLRPEGPSWDRFGFTLEDRHVCNGWKAVKKVHQQPDMFKNTKGQQ